MEAAANEKSEAEIQAEILLRIGSMPGVQVMRINTGLFETASGHFVRSAENGTHDLLLCVQMTVQRKELIRSGSMQFDLPRFLSFGQLVWMEVKKPGRNLSEDQERFARVWEKAGAIATIATSPEEAADFLEHITDYVISEKEPPLATKLIGE